MKYLIALGALFIACEGPVGPAGPQGAQGTPGEQGAPGEDGPPGAANITVATFSILTSQIDTSGNTGIYLRAIPEITQDVFNKGVVLVYVQIGGFWAPLPVTDSYDYNNNLGVDEVVEMTYLYSVGQLVIFYYDSFEPVFLAYFYTGPFKVVIIPPGSLGKKIPDMALIQKP